MKREIDYSYSTTFCDLVISIAPRAKQQTNSFEICFFIGYLAFLITYFSCTLLLGLLSFIFPAILGELNACTDSK